MPRLTAVLLRCLKYITYTKDNKTVGVKCKALYFLMKKFSGDIHFIGINFWVEYVSRVKDI